VNKGLRTRFIIVLIVIGISIYFLYPTIRIATMDPAERKRLEVENPEALDKLLKKSIKLGLDLKGGMHLVLEVDDSQLKESEKTDVLDRALEVIRNRVDQFGVSEPVIQKQGTKRIIVQLPGLQDAERAKRLIGQTAMLEWRLVRKQSEVAQVLRKLDKVLKETMKDSLVELGPAGGAEKEIELGIDTISTEKKSEDVAEAGVPEVAPLDTSIIDSTLLTGTEEESFNLPLETISKDKPFTSLLESFSSVGFCWLATIVASSSAIFSDCFFSAILAFHAGIIVGSLVIRLTGSVSSGSTVSGSSTVSSGFVSSATSSLGSSSC